MLSYFGITGLWLYVVIFLGKMAEVSFSTLRIMFVGKSRKLEGALFGFIEIALWVIVVSSVLNGLSEDPMKAVVYCVAFTLGIPLGVQIEGLLAVGLTSIQVVAANEYGEKIGVALREHGFGVTFLDGHSVDGTKRELVFVQLKRKRINDAVEIIKEIDPAAVISVSDLRSFRGGFLK